ncbi:MAG: nitroreductase family protein [Gammaproteobacteria bacterium]|nr:nitroreductase family protein [Gammaproteobacteria bacterium]
MTRRQFVGGMATAVLGGVSASAFNYHRSNATYQSLAAETWRHGDPNLKPHADVMKELVRYATLAANSHNTQPWRFALAGNRITIYPDFARRCPIVDPDDHHLFISLGCAAENLVQAAAAYGLSAAVSFNPATQGAIEIDLANMAPRRSALFEAIPTRQCTRAEYNGKPVPTAQLDLLGGTGEYFDVSAFLLTDKRRIESVLAYVLAGNSAQISDAAFIRELTHWMRFNAASAARWRDGLYSAASGNPQLPDWLGRMLLRVALTESGQNDLYRRQVRSSSGVIAFIGSREDKAGWTDVGRCCQRFMLQATALGIQQAFINQPIEVPAVRKQFSTYLGVGDRRVDLMLRFGYGPIMPRSLRRPPERVITAS